MVQMLSLTGLGEADRILTKKLNRQRLSQSRIWDKEEAAKYRALKKSSAFKALQRGGMFKNF